MTFERNRDSWSVFGFDVETTSFNYQQGTQMRFFTLAGKNNLRFEGYIKEEFWIYINYLLDKNHKVAIIPYNLQFDGWHIFEKDNLPLIPHKDCEWVLDKDCFDSEPAFIIFKERFKKQHYYYKLKTGEKIKKKRATGRILTFLDLGNYVYPRTMGLNEIAKTFLSNIEYKKDKPDFDAEITKDYRDYCYQDSRICFLAFEKWFKKDCLKKHKILVSSSASSFELLKKTSGWRSFYRPLDVKEDEQNSFFGGLNWINPGLSPNDWIYAQKLDVNSMYPSVMQDMKVPIKYLRYHASNMLPKRSKHFYCMIRAKVKVLYPLLPIRNEDDKTLSYPLTGEFSRFFTEDELFGLEKLKIIKILEVYGYHLYRAKKKMFKGFIKKKWQARLKAKKADNTGLSAKLKLDMNGSYGKFAQRERIRKTLSKEQEKSPNGYLDFIKFSMDDYDELSQEIDGIIYRKRFGEIIYDEKTTKEARGKCTLVSSIITSLARLKLSKKIMSFKGQVIYADTDMVTVPYSLIKDYKVSKKLGAWDYELLSGFFQIRGKKDYCILSENLQIKIKYKGAPATSYNLRDWTQGVFTYDHLIKVKEAQRRGLEPFIFVETEKIRHKTLPKPVKSFREPLIPWLDNAFFESTR